MAVLADFTVVNFSSVSRRRRTDSESSGSSFASLGLSVLSRGGSKVERVGRGRGLDHRESDISLASVNSDRRKESSGSKRGDEVAIVVSNRKDSITNAVRLVIHHLASP